MVARYVKTKSWWFPLHWVSQAVGAGLAAIAMVVMLLALKEQGSTTHFASSYPSGGSHQILGVIVLAILGLQIALGMVAHFTWQGEGSPTRPWPDKVHHWVGRGLLLAAIAATFLGIWAVQYSGVLLYVLYAVFLAVMLVIIIWFEVLFQSNKVEDGKAGP